MDLQEFKNILLESGERLKKYYRMPRLEIDSKADGSLVSAADGALNLFLKEELMRLKPEAAWLSEEEEDDLKRLSSEYVWIVDPLDGTKEFISHIPEFSISIGLVQNSIPVAGAVLNPIAEKGGICTTDGTYEFWGHQEIQLEQNLQQAQVLVSRTEFNRGSLEQYKTQIQNLKPVGSVAYKLLRVASGEDGLFFTVTPKSEWDICGGVALLRATNKIYRLFDGQAITFNSPDPTVKSGAVAGTEHLVSQFLETFEGNLLC